MPVSLQQALTNHAIADFDKIGKKHWVYLSYTESHGWDVVKFEGLCGFFQQFFRWLGFYSSTHLKTIAQRIGTEANVPPALLAKVNAAWQRQGHPPIVRQQALAAVNQPVRRQIGATTISIEQGDITLLAVQAIVNAANPACLGGGGIDHAIHAAAGPALLAECRRLPEVRPGVRCEVGNAVITGSGNLAARGIQRIVHAVGPDMRLNPPNGEELLSNAYKNSLDLIHASGMRTLALPAISTGIYGYPFEAATRVAIQTVEQYLNDHPGRFDEVKFVFFTQNEWQRAVNIGL
ncbi:MAG: macro domain-containing protein [Parachlamydiales bacterium]|nr:macro domain-containing protein [Parachlamydiales bacterium]